MPSSTSSSTCRIDWRPSRWLALALLGLGLMAALSLWLSALVPPAKLAGVPVVLAWSLVLAARHRALAPLSLDWLGGDEPAYLTGRDGVSRLDAVTVRLRGPLATLAGTDAQGHPRHLAWWPDTLAADGRRQLRLVASVSCRSVKPLRKQAA